MTKMSKISVSRSNYSHLERVIERTTLRSGIYRLRNLVSGKCYVGQAVNLRRRLGIHLRFLKQRTHRQPILRKAFGKYSPETWVFEVIELCRREHLTAQEIHHATLNAALTNGYNCAPIQAGVEVTDNFREMARGAARRFHASITAERRSEIALCAAKTKREMAAAAHRSLIALKAAATRAARRAQRTSYPVIGTSTKLETD